MSLNFQCRSSMWDVRTERRRVSASRFISAKSLRRCNPLCQWQLARAALERPRPPRTCGNPTRTAARLPGVSVGSKTQQCNASSAHGHACKNFSSGVSLRPDSRPTSSCCWCRTPWAPRPRTRRSSMCQASPAPSAESLLRRFPKRKAHTPGPCATRCRRS